MTHEYATIDRVPVANDVDRSVHVVVDADDARMRHVSVVPACDAGSTMSNDTNSDDGCDGLTVTVISFDAALSWPVVALRTRTKYVPTPTLVAVKVVAVLPVEKFARFEAPLVEPAMMM